MKKTFAIAILAVMIIAAFAVTGSVFAQSDTPQNPTYGPGWMMGGFGSGMMGGYYGGYGPMHTIMVELFAEKVGLSVDEINAEIEAGKPMYAIAEEQGLSSDDFYAWMLEVHPEALDRAVEQGLLTQEQADWMNERHEAMQTYGYGACHGGFGGTTPSSNGSYRSRGGMMGWGF